MSRIQEGLSPIFPRIVCFHFKYAGGVLVIEGFRTQSIYEERKILLSNICRGSKLLVLQDICVKVPAAYV